MIENPLNQPIFLASTSPRRIELLKAAGLPARIIAPNVDEARRRGEIPSGMVRRLAQAKAEAAVAEVLLNSGGGLIIAADTTVVAPDGKKVLGKPRDAADARQMLKLLAGRTHEVLTGYCILCVGRDAPTLKRLRVVRSKVKIRELSASHIDRYVATGEPMDKAGSYAAQGLGANFIESISGSYTNVVGLPMSQLLQDLERDFGVAFG